MLGCERGGEEGGPGGFEGVVDWVEAEDAFAVEAVVVALEAGAEAGHDQDVDGVMEVPVLQSELWLESKAGVGGVYLVDVLICWLRVCAGAGAVSAIAVILEGAVG